MIINVDIIYPIGSIYMSVNSTSPSVLFGGTWEQITGRYLMGCGSPNTNTTNSYGALTDGQQTWTFTNGERLGEYSHRLTVSELPPHNHRLGLSEGGNVSGWGLNYTANSPRYRYYGGTDFCENTGGNAYHNNMPPTLVVYIWKRTA